MVGQQLQNEATPRVGSADRSRPQPAASDYPVRDYIADMTQELAQIARWDGDEVLGGLLDAATLRAEGVRP